MSIASRQFTLTGQHHRRTGGDNQDFALFTQTPFGAAALLSDGATGCRMGGRAARLLCEATARLITEHGERIFHYTPKKLQWFFAEHLRYTLECEARASGTPLGEYGCTFCMAYCEKATGRTILIAVGDCAVFGLRGGGCRLLCPPQYTRGHRPVLVTSAQLNAFLRVELIEHLPQDMQLFVATDGCWQALQDAAAPRAAFHAGAFEEMERLLHAAQPEDDCTYITLKQE